MNEFVFWLVFSFCCLQRTSGLTICTRDAMCFGFQQSVDVWIDMNSKSCIWPVAHVCLAVYGDYKVIVNYEISRWNPAILVSHHTNKFILVIISLITIRALHLRITRPEFRSHQWCMSIVAPKVYTRSFCTGALYITINSNQPKVGGQRSGDTRLAC